MTKKIIYLLNKIAIVFYKKNNAVFNPKKILVISNTALGDTLLSTPILKTLKKNIESAHITFVINKKFLSIFKNFEYADKILPYKKGFINLLIFIYNIRKNKYDTILFLHSNGPQDLFIALYSNIPNIFKAINYPNKVSDEFHKIIKNKINYIKCQHIIEHRMDTIRNFNIKNYYKTLELPKEFHKKKIIKKNSTFTIGLQVGAADIYKMWPIDNFIKLSKLLVKNNNVSIVLLGIRKENFLCQQIKNNLPKNRIVNYCGKTNLVELIKILNTIDLLITNDTGTLHLAIALKVKTISLFSATDSRVFGPYQDFDRHTVIQKDGSFINKQPKKARDQSAMSLISVDEVYKKVDNIIKECNKCVV